MTANTTLAPANTTPAIARASDYPAGWDGEARHVWDALTATGGGTVATIAKAAKVSQKITRNVCEMGMATGVLTREGDVWRPAPAAPGSGPHATNDAAPDALSDDATPDEATSVPDAPASVAALTPEAIADAMRIMGEEADRRTAAKAELEERQRQEDARRAEIEAELARARSAEATREGLADLLATVTAAYAAVADDADADAINTALTPVFNAADALAVATGRTRPRRSRATGGRSGPAGGPVATGDRKAPTPLRPAVAAHLNAHPDADFTPGEIARVLDRSSGAVANALATMANQGEAVLTSEKPMRYRATHTSASPAVVPATGDATATDADAPV